MFSFQSVFVAGQKFCYHIHLFVLVDTNFEFLLFCCNDCVMLLLEFTLVT